MKIFQLSEKFKEVLFEGKIKNSEYSFYVDFIGRNLIDDCILPYSNLFMKTKVYDGEEILCLTERGKDHPISLLLSKDFSKFYWEGVNRSRLFSEEIIGKNILEWKYKNGKSDYKIYSSPTKSGEIVDLGFNFSGLTPYIVREDKVYFLTDEPTTIVKTGLDLKLEWKKEFFNKHKSGSTKEQLFSYSDSVICNLGCTDESSKNDGEIISLYKDSGETKWLKHFDHEIHSCVVVQGQIYITGHNLWYVLSAETGDIVLQGDADLPSDIPGTGNSLWSDGEFIYFSSSPANLIRIYKEETGDYWGDINMPQGFKVDWDAPMSHKGFHYFRLIASNWAEMGTVHGVLVFNTEDIRQGTPFDIEIEKCDSYTARFLEGEKGQYIQLEFDEPELGQILRFGQIEANKLAVNNTYNHMASLADDYGQHINKSFNGQIRIRIKKSVLKEIKEDRLDLMCEFINEQCKDYLAPYSKKQDVKASWEWI